MLRIVIFVILGVIAFAAALSLRSRGSIPQEGTAAPDFSLPSQEGSPVSLSQYRGHWVVLYFYPKDQTPGCTREAHNFAADQAGYRRRDAVVLGVSVDSVDSHRRFCENERLNFKLLADRDGKTAHAYGSLTDLGVAKFAARRTFIIDPAGKVARVFLRVDPASHSTEVIAALDRLQSPQVLLRPLGS